MQKENEIEEMKKQTEIMKDGQKELVELLKNPTKLLQILHRDVDVDELSDLDFRIMS